MFESTGIHAYNPPEQVMTTAMLGIRVGYSTQQVRDLERLGVLPVAERGANGYRRYSSTHETALRAYRAMASAIGPVPARRLMPVLIAGPLDDAAATIDDLHADIAGERARVKEALAGLAVAVAEAGDVFREEDAMSIGELADALDVRPSALRHWEREGLLHPARSSGVRSFGSGAVTEGRIIAALRSGGYGIPAIADILEQVRDRAAGDAQRLLAERLTALTQRSIALLHAAGHLSAMLAERDPNSRRTAGSSQESS
ncbi:MULTISPECIES: MerR family transcriptional regulator [unclassified Microbacterium]|uniref:MerR family transcriptional regulator n=1 Tax=unclassified Microbacterium TaxID=2609290 RepID=UPI0030181E14